MTTFNHLNVPDQWNQYFSKYPQGYTILEALLNWVQQVDSMVDNVNDWNTYLDSFKLSFDTDLQGKVETTLTDWKNSGFLDAVIETTLGANLEKAKTDLNSVIALKADKTETDSLQSQINGLSSGAPKAVSLANQMTDQTKNYVYTGAETGYTAGNWYYYNGTSWVSGGVYQSTGIADNSIKSEMLEDTVVTPLTPTWTNDKYVGVNGGIYLSSGFKYSSEMALKAGETIRFMAKGFSGNVALLSKSFNDVLFPLIISTDSVEKEFSYVATSDCSVVISTDSSSGVNIRKYVNPVALVVNNKDFISGLNGDITGVTSYTNGFYINGSGDIAPHDLYKYSAPIQLDYCETIHLTARGESPVALLSTCDQNGGSIAPLTMATGLTDNQIATFTNTTKKPIYIIVCGHMGYDFIVTKQLLLSTVTEQVQTDDTDYAQIFHKIGVIGDSLSSGELAYTDSNGDHYVDCYEYSWLSNVARATGANKVHYSKGGMTAKYWMSDAGGYKTALLNETEPCSAYFLALGTNDKSQSYPLGSIGDVAGTDSFVGYMRQIIELIIAKNPNAAIFLVSLYGVDSSNIAYSNMIKNIATLYSNCFYVDFINNTTINTATGGNDSSLSHFTTTGYVKVAKTIHKLINDIVSSNMSFFKFFGLNNN